MDTNRHLFRVYLHKEGAEHPIDAGTVEFHGQPYDFDGPDARKALVEDGRLSIGSDLAGFGDVIIPTAKLERIVVTLEMKGVVRPATEEPEPTS